MITRQLRYFAKRTTQSTWFDIAIIFAAGLLPLSWFRGSLIAGMDLPFPLAAPNQLLREATSLWNPTVGLGASSPSFRMLIYPLFSSMPRWFGLSPVGTEKLWFVFWFAGAGLSAYFLIRVLVPQHRLAAVLGGLFYMLNPYTMIVRWYELNFWLFFYALLPMLLAFFILVIRTGRMLYLSGFLLASLVVSPAFSNLGALVILILVLGGYLVIHIIQNRRMRDKVWLALRYTLILIVLFIGIGMWWVLPTGPMLRQEASIRATPDTTMERVEFTSRNSTLGQVLRLDGYCWWDLQFGGTQDAAITYAKSYNNPFFGILGWIIPALGIAGLWMIRRYKGLLWPALLWLGGVFFMKGLQPPLGGITKWMFQSVPGMDIFRHPFDKFGMIALLGLAPLIGIGMENTHHFFRKIIGKKPISKIVAAVGLGVIAVLLLVVLVWPFWTGDVIYGGGQIIPSFRIPGVPAEYQQARSWLAQQGDDFRILSLPYNRISWTLSLFNWYQGDDPTRWLLGMTDLTPSSDTGGELSEEAAYDLVNQSDLAQKMCSLLNVKYVLLRGDANWDILGGNIFEKSAGNISAPREVLEDNLNNQNWLKQEARFGDLIFYLNLDWRPVAAFAADSLQTINLVTPNLFAVAESSWQAIGRVDYSVDESGNLSINGTSDEGEDWVGVEKPLQLDSEGPFLYSYEFRASASEVYTEIDLYDQAGKLITSGLLQSAIDNTYGWATYSGLIPKYAGAYKAVIKVLMKPMPNGNIQLRNFSMNQQAWINAISESSGIDNGDDSAAGAGILMSDEDAEVLGLANRPGSDSSSPTCTLEKSSPWSVKLKVECDEPCFLVFDQAFDEGWHLYDGSPNWLQIFGGSTKSSFKHFLANGYANAWNINEPGTYEFTLYYRPQAFLYLGIVISILSWVILGVFIYFQWRRKNGGGDWKLWFRKAILPHRET